MQCDVPHDEAVALLAIPSVCEDATEWGATKERSWYQYIEQGLLREDGTRAGLVMKIEYSSTPKTGRETMQFSIYKSRLGGLSRMYQLTIDKFRKPIKDKHKLPHEHIGDLKRYKEEWLYWSFEQAMAHFCKETSLTIRPPIGNPTQLRLTAS